MRTHIIIVTTLMWMMTAYSQAMAQVSDTDGGVSYYNTWVTADVSNPTPYQGQQIIYTFRLYCSVPLRDFMFHAPKFHGFSAREIDDSHTYSKIINNREFEVTEMYYLLTPLAAGVYPIEPAEMQVAITQRRRSKEFGIFGAFSLTQERSLHTETLSIEVRPLPTLPEGQKFSGLVGRFDLKTDLESQDLKVGDSATLVVTVQGRGNIMHAQVPDIQVPDAFKTYAGRPQEEVNLDRNGCHGKRVFRTVLVPLEAGQFQLPAATLTYFDPDQNAYRTLAASVPDLNVTPSQNAPGASASTGPEPLTLLKRKVAFTGKDILPPKEDLAAIQSQQPLHWALFLLGLAVPVLVFGGIMGIRHLRRQDTSPAAMMKVKARQALKAAHKSSPEQFLSILYQALTAAILSAGGRRGEALTWKEAEALLFNNGRSQEEAREAADLLSKVESYKYSGRSLSDQERDELLAKTRQEIRRLVT